MSFDSLFYHHSNSYALNVEGCKPFVVVLARSLIVSKTTEGMTACPVVAGIAAVATEEEQ